MLLQKTYTDSLENLEEEKSALDKVKSELSQVDDGKLQCEKIQLEKTVKSLTQEVENLSITNEGLIEDLRQKEFFDKYYEMKQKYEKIRRYNEKLLDLKVKNLCDLKDLKSTHERPKNLKMYSSVTEVLTNLNSSDRNNLSDYLSKPNYSSTRSPGKRKISLAKVPRKDLFVNDLDQKVGKKKPKIKKISLSSKMSLERIDCDRAVRGGKSKESGMRCIGHKQYLTSGKNKGKKLGNVSSSAIKVATISHEEISQEQSQNQNRNEKKKQ